MLMFGVLLMRNVWGESPDPLDDPQAIEERVQTGSPEDVAVDRSTGTNIVRIALPVALLVFALALWWGKRGVAPGRNDRS